MKPRSIKIVKDLSGRSTIQMVPVTKASSLVRSNWRYNTLDQCLNAPNYKCCMNATMLWHSRKDFKCD